MTISNFACPKCGLIGANVRHGYYSRYFIHDNQKHVIEILRIRCKQCGSTHGILPTFLLSYFQVTLTDVIQILQLKSQHQYDCFLDNHFILDESHIRHIKKDSLYSLTKLKK